jgi:hypothetical protein
VLPELPPAETGNLHITAVTDVVGEVRREGGAQEADRQPLLDTCPSEPPPPTHTHTSMHASTFHTPHENTQHTNHRR